MFLTISELQGGWIFLLLCSTLNKRYKMGTPFLSIVPELCAWSPYEVARVPCHDLARSFDRLLSGTPFTQESADDATDVSFGPAIVVESGRKGSTGERGQCGAHR